MKLIFHLKDFPWNSSSRNLASCMTPNMTLEREAKHNNWKDSFQEIETKIYTSDRFTCLTNDTSLRRSNSSLNRYYYIVILILLSFFKKRYPNVSAYDHSRVRLTHNDEDVYINANLVKAPETERQYILSQGNILKFWWMLI